jgi:hypothetical protein
VAKNTAQITTLFALGNLCLSNAGEGIVDFALCPDDATETIDRTGGRGIAYAAPVPGSRVQPNGQEIRWQLGWAVDETLPFLCADVTDREMRVPTGACRQHPNRVTGIGEVAVAVRSLDAAIQVYERLLQAKVTYPGDGTGLRSAAFRIGETSLVLVEPEPEETPAATALREQLMRRGPGAYRVTLRAPAQTSLPLDNALTHGAAVSIGPC